MFTHLQPEDVLYTCTCTAIRDILRDFQYTYQYDQFNTDTLVRPCISLF